MSDTKAPKLTNGNEPNVNLDVKAKPQVKPTRDEGVGRDAQPDIINLKHLQTSTLQEIESDVLRPVVFAQDNTFCRFELEPKGFLSPGSSISFAMLSPGEDVGQSYFPLSVGVHSLITRAVLKTSSGRVITDTEEFSSFSGYKGLFLNSSVQKEREQYISGRCMAWENIYDPPDATAGDWEATTDAQNIALSNGKEYGGLNTAGGDGGLTPRNCCVMTDEASRVGLNPSFSVALHDLFPFLKAGNQLPLFMFGSDRIQVELYFSPIARGTRVQLSGEDDAKSMTAEWLINQNSVELISDHIFYPGRMDEWEQKNKDLTFQYFDYNLSRQTITASHDVDDTSTTNIRQVGGAGRIVTRAFAMYQPNNTTNPDLSILSNFQATGPTKTGENPGRLESNLFYNERFLYPINITNNARHFHNLRDAEQKQVYTTRQVYSGGGNSLAGGGDWMYNGHDQDELQSSQFYQAWRLNRGERIGTKGVELTMNCRSTDGTLLGLPPGIYTQMVYTEQLRYATLKNGQLEVYFA